MTVLFILGILLSALALNLLFTKINQYTTKRFKFEFFNLGTFILSAFGYWSIVYGYNWYKEVFFHGGDLLNGQLLMAIGILLISLVVYLNIKRTSVALGLSLSIIQQLIYIPLSAIAFIAFIMALGYASETRPVYNINTKG